MITYKTLQETDISKYPQSILSVVNTLTGAGDHTESSLLETIKEINNQGSTILVAIDTQVDEVVGSVTMVCEKVIQRGGGYVGHLEMLIVRKERQGKGIGSELLKRAIELAKEKGCYKIIGQAIQELSPYYQKFGFDTSEIGLKMYL